MSTYQIIVLSLSSLNAVYVLAYGLNKLIKIFKSKKHNQELKKYDSYLKLKEFYEKDCKK